jgi:hypothetical protein
MIVIDGVHAEVTGYLSGEQPLEMLEGLGEGSELQSWPSRPIKCFDGFENRPG